MLFCCLWRNVEISCHKHFVVVSRHQQTPPLTTSDKCHNLPRSGRTVLITPGGRSVDSTRWSHILAQNRDFCLPHLHSTPLLAGPHRNIAMTFSVKNQNGVATRCHGENKLIFWRYVYSFWQNVTDGWITHDGVGSACIASRGKNVRNIKRVYMTNFFDKFRDKALY